jgi:hypothetical protein
MFLLSLIWVFRTLLASTLSGTIFLIAHCVLLTNHKFILMIAHRGFNKNKNNRVLLSGQAQWDILNTPCATGRGIYGTFIQRLFIIILNFK